MLKVFTVYDSKLEAYLPPFFMPARGQAVRSFSDSISAPDSVFGRHPEDYTLFELGEFDDQCCVFTLYKTPYSLGLASELVSKS